MIESTMFHNKWLKTITSDIEFSDNRSYRRVISVNTILVLTIFTFLFFTVYNILTTRHFIIALLDLTAAVVSLYALYDLQKSKNVNRAAQIATLNLSIFFILFIYTNGSDHFGLIWSIFLPVFAITVNGRHRGLYFSVLFYLLIFYMAYNGIGVWSAGEWTLTDFLRLLFASVILTFVMYINEYALEKSDHKLNKIRKREKTYIQQLQDLAVTDELTTLYNRRHFNELAPKLISLAKRKHLYLTFMVTDVDHFKSYNDHYGHQAGDKALAEVAKIIKHQIQRDDDFVFRLGGDEFAGIALSYNPKRMHEHIDSICKRVEELKIEHAFSSTSDYLTISIGVTTVHPGLEYTVEYLYKSADANLYKAKEMGKNRCYIEQHNA